MVDEWKSAGDRLLGGVVFRNDWPGPDRVPVLPFSKVKVATAWMTCAAIVSMIVFTTSCECAGGDALACERVTSWYSRNRAAHNAGLYRFCPKGWLVHDEYKPGGRTQATADAVAVNLEGGYVLCPGGRVRFLGSRDCRCQ